MSSLYELKPRFQQFLQPLVPRLQQWGISANRLTCIAIGLSLLGGGVTLLASSQPAWLPLIPAVLVVRMALNALDGMVARQLQQATQAGAVLNEVGDVVSDLALYLPWMAFQPAPWPSQLAVLGFAVLAVLSEFCGVLAQALVGERRYDGPMGKSDRALLVGLLALTLFFMPRAVTAIPWVFGVACLLLVQSCFHRLRVLWRQPAQTHDMTRNS
ncbi:MAG: CDP-alcohol phosphatidyltransferase family protein [Cyanobacteriota bacterium]|nr:CDP-alcohol phosphatidyltransferase family protein [Cyanobacteriota bacterium]